MIFANRPLTAAALITLLLLSLLAPTGFAQHPARRASLPAATKSVPDGKATVARLETLIPQLMNDGDVTGLSIALIRDGKIEWARGFGFVALLLAQLGQRCATT